MSVKVKDRHVSKHECLQKSRELMEYILVLTRPREFDKDGKQICKPGLLGEDQPLQAFGYALLAYGNRIHSACYQAGEIYLNSEDTLNRRNKYHLQALDYCDSIFRQINLCIFQYARNNKDKRHLVRLNKAVKTSLQDRLNRDKLICKNKYVSPKRHIRG